MLFVHSGNLYGGVERVLETVARHPTDSLESHFALCFEGLLSSQLAALGSPVHWLGPTRMRHPLSILRARRALSALLRRYEFHVCVVNSGWIQGLLGSVPQSTGVPLVAWMHNPPDPKSAIDRFAARVRPDLIIANSQFTAEQTGRRYRGVPCEVVYYPVSLSTCELASAQTNTLRQDLGALPGDVVILQASRLDHWKGHAVLLEALAHLRDLPHWKCWIAGGAQRPDEVRRLRTLERQAAALQIEDRVMFLGQRSDVDRLLCAADVFCQPNTTPEPFGVVFVEALHAGLPVVMSRCGGALEIVDESCGALIARGDVDGVARALRDLITDSARRERLGAAGRGRARELCDPSTRVPELAAVLRSARHA